MSCWFFCLDKNTLLLSIVSLIIMVVYFIGKNNDKFYQTGKESTRKQI